jgi:hypothetical protein
LRIDQQTPWGRVSTSASDARPRELTGSACARSRIIGEPDRAAEPPVDLAVEWEQGVARLTREHRQRRLRTGSSSGRRVVPSGSLRGSNLSEQTPPRLGAYPPPHEQAAAQAKRGQTAGKQAQGLRSRP